MNINKLIMRWHMLTLSPIFPSLLAFVLITIYKLFFDPITLCDDGNAPLFLDQLKNNLVDQTVKSTAIVVDIDEVYANINEMKDSDTFTSDEKKYNYNKLNKLQKMLIKSLKRTMEIED